MKRRRKKKKAMRHENKRKRWVRSYCLIWERDEVAWVSLIEEEVMRSGHKEEPDRTEQNQTEQSRKGG